MLSCPQNEELQSPSGFLKTGNSKHLIGTFPCSIPFDVHNDPRQVPIYMYSFVSNERVSNTPRGISRPCWLSSAPGPLRVVGLCVCVCVCMEIFIFMLYSLLGRHLSTHRYISAQASLHQGDLCTSCRPARYPCLLLLYQPVLTFQSSFHGVYAPLCGHLISISPSLVSKYQEDRSSPSCSPFTL